MTTAEKISFSEPSSAELNPGQMEGSAAQHPSRGSDRRHTSVVGQPAYTEKGPLIDHKIPQAEVVQQEPDLVWSRLRRSIREPLAEFFGTFILVLFGDGSIAQVILSNGTKGEYQSIAWGWG